MTYIELTQVDTGDWSGVQDVYLVASLECGDRSS